MNKKENRVFWTYAKVKYLKDNYNKIPAISIAVELSCTKNAVVGKANRLGLNETLKNKINNW